MEQSHQNNIATFKFQDAREGTRSTVVGNVFLLLIFIFLDVDIIFENSRTIFISLSILVVVLAIFFYDWSSLAGNLSVASGYLIFCFLEMQMLGMPESWFSIGEDGISKGLMFELLISMMPIIYVLLRFGLVLPLFYVTYRSYQLISTSKAAKLK